MKKILLILFLLILSFNCKTVYANETECNIMLGINSKGNNVKSIQTKLNRTMSCNLDVDGDFGPLTQQCVINFQKKYKLEQDGVVGPKTCKKLNAAYIIEVKKSYVVVIGSEVNVRSGPNTTSSIKTTVKQGEVLRTYGKTTVDGQTWYKVYIKSTRVDTHYGYISGTYAKNTAILLDRDNQQLTYYYGGKILMSAPVITGKKGSHDTPAGRYIINPNNKSTNETLTGTNDDGTTYKAPVKYWMPFITDRGIGFHDASWRKIEDYNTNTYIENGSHGCVNMRYNDAERLYNNLRKQTYVIVK